VAVCADARQSQRGARQHFLLPPHRLLELDPGQPDAGHPRRHRQQIVEQSRLMVGDLRRMHHKKDPIPAGDRPKVESQGLQQLGARALHEGKIVGVEHHAAGVGVLIVDPDRPRESADPRERVGLDRPPRRRASCRRKSLRPLL